MERFVAWLRQDPGTEAEVVDCGSGSHVDAVLKDGGVQGMDVPETLAKRVLDTEDEPGEPLHDLAYDRGWVRVSVNHVQRERGVSARDHASARKALRWMIDQELVSDEATVEILEPRGAVVWSATLRDEEVDRYLRHGRGPRTAHSPRP